MPMDRKCIFVTGAASGMGLATARLFAEKGWFVGAYDVNGEGLHALAGEIGQQNCITETLDVTIRKDYQAALARFGDKTDGKLDLLYNNAGIGEGGAFADMDYDAIMKVINVNFIGVVTGIYEALPLLRATDNALCFTTSSSSAIIGIPGIAIYSATKHAVKGLTEALSVEFAAYGIRAADTLPGVIDTAILPDEMKAAAPKEGMWRLMPAKAVADVVWQAYHSDKLHWYVPEELAAHEIEVATAPEAIRDSRIGTAFGDTELLSQQ